MTQKVGPSRHDYQFILSMRVRDYECDLQGIVNNSVYQNYLEHARHEFLQSRQVDFAALSRQDIDLVVVRAELDYRLPLRPGDHFYVGLTLVPNGRLRMDFQQVIHRSSDDKVMLQARITAAALNARGRPFAPTELMAQLQAESLS